MLLQISGFVAAIGIIAMAAFGFPHDKDLFSAKCGEGFLSLQLVTKTDNLMYGPKTHAQLTYRINNKNRVVDRYGYQPPDGTKILFTLPEGQIDKAHSKVDWNLVLRSDTFSPEEIKLITSCLQENGAQFNKALSEANLDGVTGLERKGSSLVLHSVSVLEPISATGGTNFLSSDGIPVQVSADNSVWIQKTHMTSRIGYIDSSTQNFHFDRWSSEDQKKRIQTILQSAKNSNGKRFFDLFKIAPEIQK